MQGLGRRGAMSSRLTREIPASTETLIRHQRAPRGLIAARYAAKSEAA
jgi:hypothetical protein